MEMRWRMVIEEHFDQDPIKGADCGHRRILCQRSHQSNLNVRSLVTRQRSKPRLRVPLTLYRCIVINVSG
jgi:hypothetical protein